MLMGEIMSDQTTIELTTLLPAEILERLEAEAERRDLPLAGVVREAITTYLEDRDADEDEYEDTPDEVILADLREAFADALAGRTRPAREVLEEIRQSLEAHDDKS